MIDYDVGAMLTRWAEQEAKMKGQLEEMAKRVGTDDAGYKAYARGVQRILLQLNRSRQIALRYLHHD